MDATVLNFTTTAGLPIKEYMLAVSALLTAVVPLVMHYYKPKVTTMNRRKTDMCNVSLKSHPFFNTIDFWIKVTAPKIAIDHPLKRRCIRVFLVIKLKVFYEGLLKAVESMGDANNINCVCTNIPALFGGWIEEYEKEARNAGVPEVFIYKFSEWHSIHVEATFTACKNICSSSVFHPTDYDKMAGILDMMMNTFHVTMLDAEATLNSLNGELTSALEHDSKRKVGLWKE